MKLKLEKALPSQKSVLRNLYSLYLHDLSEYNGELEINEEGIFEFDAFEMIWEKEGLNPFFIKEGDKIAGFILLLSKPLIKRVDYVINDMFILKGYRGKKISEAAVKLLFDAFKGEYYAEQLKDNKRAIAFWRKIYAKNELEFLEEEKDDVFGQFFTVPE